MRPACSSLWRHAADQPIGGQHDVGQLVAGQLVDGQHGRVEQPLQQEDGLPVEAGVAMQHVMGGCADKAVWGWAFKGCRVAKAAYAGK